MLALLICCISSCLAARPDAKAVVETAASRLRKAPVVQAVFSVSAPNGASSGALTVSGKRFAMATPELKVWFDGKTQWAYAPQTGEVNVSEPTAEELSASNPLSVLTNMTSSYNCRRLSSNASSDVIELTPKGDTDIARAVIKFSTATGLPVEIKVTDREHTISTITISSLTTGGKAPSAGAFRFTPKDYPGVEVVDLR